MALESGRVNSYREALVVVRFGSGSAIECVVDTGFDGGLMLPRAVLSEIQIEVSGRVTFEMVGGATMSAEVGLSEIEWLGRLQQVEVIVSESEDALIGTELLIASTLTVDYSSGTLTIPAHD
jgi:clan AA aspartic protease